MVMAVMLMIMMMMMMIILSTSGYERGWVWGGMEMRFSDSAHVHHLNIK